MNNRAHTLGRKEDKPKKKQQPIIHNVGGEKERDLEVGQRDYNNPKICVFPQEGSEVFLDIVRGSCCKFSLLW